MFRAWLMVSFASRCEVEARLEKLPSIGELGLL
jgi:hypothetical protein